MRKGVAALAVLAVVGLGTGGAEIGLHGLSFFLFRNAGAGAGNSQDLNENQGPGQPDAPGTQHSTPARQPTRRHPSPAPHHQHTAPGKSTGQHQAH
jgi:hypothetical protein